MNKKLKIKLVENCARCGKNHRNLEFNRFTRVCKDFTHWAMCPVTRQPVMLQAIDDPAFKV